ncbi:uncharacterized protein BX664DRAFT_317151 [Halteromyces radiatus]|uniref:uncharacterized protein n=1 Tax=Halteromyces radiatus TaxID=101107 RepID=UPI0022201F2B|nr:uncharacterized protein BX664DRAFT_317151 [Halteromyces radiatus]KAI8083164.1 hypothetical protein BX664DRAFT_317151 [Halteromyces radiatus]
MTSWATHYFPSSHDVNRRSTAAATTRTTTTRTTWSEGPRLVRQNAFILDPTEPYTFDSLPPTSEQSSISSLSSFASTLSSAVSEEEQEEYQQQQQKHSFKIVQKRRPSNRSPIPQNTGDYDEPFLPARLSSRSFSLQSWLEYIRSILRTILLMMMIYLGYQIFACTELQPMPTERLYAVDPGAPTHVWIPVFQWTCWRHTWMGRYPSVTLWITGTIIGLYWMHWKRR